MKSYEEYYTEFMDYLFKQKISPVWKVIFFILLIVHGIFFYVIGSTFFVYAGGMVFIVLIPIAIILVFIDFIVVLLYILKRHPHGIAKVVFNTVLTVIGLLS